MVFPTCLPKDIVIEIIDFLSVNQQRHLASSLHLKIKQTTAILTMLNWPDHVKVYSNLSELRLDYMTTLKPLIPLTLDTLIIPSVADFKSLNRIRLKCLVVLKTSSAPQLLSKLTNPYITQLTVNSIHHYDLIPFPVAAQLTTVGLTNAVITDFTCFHRLTKLVLTTCDISNLSTIHGLYLEALILEGCIVNATGIDQLRINHLELDCNCEIDHIDLFRHIPYTSVNVAHSAITDGFFTSPNLTSVIIASPHITTDVFRRYSHVKELELGLANLREEFKYDNENLTTLYLYDCDIRPDILTTMNIPNLVSLMAWKTSIIPTYLCLMELLLGETELPDEFYSQLPLTLTELTLSQCHVRNHHLEFIGMLSLNTLNLPDNPIGDVGVAHLNSLLSLTKLGLDKTLITNASSAILQRFTLTTLTLTQTNLTTFAFLRDQPISELRVGQLRGPELYDIIDLPLIKLSFDPAIFEKKYLDLIPPSVEMKVLDVLFNKYPWTMARHVLGYYIRTKVRKIRI